jgi:hypothetical protein
VTCESTALGYQLSGSELRMLGAVMRQSICDACMCGEDRTAFQGYLIETRCIDAASEGHPMLLLTLRTGPATEILDRLFVAVALNRIPSSPFDISFDWVRAWESPRTESPVGCVSPNDVRNASPETGPISCKPASRKAWRFCQCFLSVTQSGSSLPALGVVSLFPCVPCL